MRSFKHIKKKHLTKLNDHRNTVANTFSHKKAKKVNIHMTNNMHLDLLTTEDEYKDIENSEET